MMQALVFWIAVGFSCALGACVLVGLLCKTGAHLRTFWRCGWALVVAAAVAIIYGGTKNLLPKFTADAGLHVVKATMALATNETDYTSLVVEWTGPDADEPMWVRDGVSERWQGFPFGDWNFVGRTYEGGTNSVEYFINPGVSASNATVWACWHLGLDLPPVEVDGDGVTIEDFQVTSKWASLRYAVNPAALTGSGAVSVEVQRGTSPAWNEIYRLPVSAPVTNTVQFIGFWVGETTRWRVRLEVDE